MTSAVLFSVFIFAAVLLVAACSSKLAGWLNVPVLLLFLTIGMLARWQGLGGHAVPSDNFVNVLGTIALAFILFSGGLDTKWRSVLPVMVPGLILSSVGVLLTALAVGIFVYFAFGDHKFVGCFLLGAIVSSTDAAAVFAILRGKGIALREKLQNLLEFESGSNDPMATFLTVFLVGMMQSGEGSYWMILPSFLLRIGLGICLGYIIGRLMVKLFNAIDFDYDGLYYVLGIGTVLLVYGLTEILQGNGFMAVYVCGVLMGNSRVMYRNNFNRFNDAIAWLMQVLLFTTLGLMVTVPMLVDVWDVALPTALFLMFIARPVVVMLCLAGSGFKLREKLFVSWVGLRGGAPIMLATIPLMAFGSEKEATRLGFAVVFMIVILSVLIQGKTMMPLARLLKLDRPLKIRLRKPIEFDYTGTLSGEMKEFELPVEHGGKRLPELGLPRGALVLLIRRGKSFLVPHGGTVLEPDDGLMILGEEPVLHRIGREFGTEPEIPTPSRLERRLRALTRFLERIGTKGAS